MFSSIAHEINSPLAAAQLMLSRAERKGRDGTLDQSALVDLIVKSNRSLDRAAIISKGLQYYVELPVSDDAATGPVDEIIMTAVKFCEHAFGDPRVNIVADFATIKGLHVSGDFSRLAHAFTNLLSSLYKDLAASAGGQIMINAKIEGEFIFVEMNDSDFRLGAKKDERVPARSLIDEDTADKDLEIKLARQLYLGCRAEISTVAPHTRYVIKLKKINIRAS